MVTLTRTFGIPTFQQNIYSRILGRTDNASKYAIKTTKGENEEGADFLREYTNFASQYNPLAVELGKQGVTYDKLEEKIPYFSAYSRM